MSHVQNNLLDVQIDQKVDVIDGYHDVPTANSSDNSQTRDVVGNKSDKSLSTPGSDSLYGIAAYMAYYHVHSSANCYPVLAGAIEVAASANAWTDYGSWIQIIPASTISDPFDLHWAFISEVSAAGEYVFQIGAGAPSSEVVIATEPFVRGSSALNAQLQVPVQIPPQAADTRISVRLSSSNAVANTAKFKFYYHTYPQ